MSPSETPASSLPVTARVAVRQLSRTIRISRARIVEAVRAALGASVRADISVVLIDDAAMSALHERYLRDPSPTDVLTFDLREHDDDAIEGEIVISLETARRQARQHGEEEVEEVLRYVIHGVLHLLGYDDHAPADRSRMRRKERRVLAMLDGAGRRAARK